jgi:hypothetical protein
MAKDFKKMIEPHIDEWGMLGDVYYDRPGYIGAGDSAQRTGMVFLFENVTGIRVMDERDDKYLAEQLLNPPRRHIDASRGSGTEGTLSRDNSQSMICANSYFARKIGVLLIKRLGLFWNWKDLEWKKKKIPIVDWAGPSTWASIIRSAGLWYLYPLLLILDIGLLLSTVSVLLIYKQSLPVKESEIIRAMNTHHPSGVHTTDLLNKECMTILGRAKYPTPFSLLARWLFRLKCSKVIQGLYIYFRPRANFMPLPIPEMYEYVRKKGI